MYIYVFALCKIEILLLKLYLNFRKYRFFPFSLVRKYKTLLKWKFTSKECKFMREVKKFVYKKPYLCELTYK